jgi:hypothetical protein
VARGVIGVGSIRRRDERQPVPPDERAGVAHFQQLQGSDVSAEKRRGVRQHLIMVAEVQEEPRRVSWLAEGEGIRLDSGLEEPDLERPLADGVVLADELVQAAVSKHPIPVCVDVDAV